MGFFSYMLMAHVYRLLWARVGWVAVRYLLIGEGGAQVLSHNQ